MKDQLEFLDEEVRRAVEAYAAMNGCSEVEAVNAILGAACSKPVADVVDAHLARHKALGLKDDDTGAEVA